MHNYENLDIANITSAIHLNKHFSQKSIKYHTNLTGFLFNASCHNCEGQDGGRWVKFNQFHKDEKLGKESISKVNRVESKGFPLDPSKATRLCFLKTVLSTTEDNEVRRCEG